MLETPIDAINVEVDGVKYSISKTSPKTSLNEWLRSQPGLKGDVMVLVCVVRLLRETIRGNSAYRAYRA